jgi:enamine deaminase RidA (YjgF/YER057c/UK114 family)
MFTWTPSIARAAEATTANARNGACSTLASRAKAGTMNSFVWSLAVALLVSVSVQGLHAQACTPPGDVETKLTQLGITLPVAPQPVANYVQAVRSGKLVFLAGTAPKNPDGTLVTGKVGTDLSVDQGY